MALRSIDNVLTDELARERHLNKTKESQLQEQERLQELLRQENKDLSIELGRQENRIKEAKSQLHDVLSENAALARQLQETELQLEEARRELLDNSRITEEFAEHQRLVNDLAQSNAQLKGGNVELHDQVFELQSQLAQTLTELLESEQNVIAQSATIEELSELVQSLECQLSDLRSADLEKSQRIDMLVQDVQELQNTSSASLLMDPDSLRSELRGGRKLSECRVEELAKLVELEQNENVALQSMMEHLKATISALETNTATQHDLQRYTLCLEQAVQELFNISRAVDSIVLTANTITNAVATVVQSIIPHMRSIDDAYTELLDVSDMGLLPIKLCRFADHVSSSLANLGFGGLKVWSFA